MKKLCFLLSLISILCLSSCSTGNKRTARNILNDIMEDCDFILPSGKIYEYGAEEGTEQYLSSSMISALYGEDAESEVISLTDDYAVYISGFAEPYEIAVFRCRSKNDTDRLISMCLTRREQLQVLLAGTDYSGFADSARIYSEGKFVIMISVGDKK